MVDDLVHARYVLRGNASSVSLLIGIEQAPVVHNAFGHRRQRRIALPPRLASELIDKLFMDGRYFRLNTVQPYVKEGRMRLVKGAAAIAYPAYAVYSEGANIEMLMPALAGLRHVAATLHAQGADATGSRTAMP